MTITKTTPTARPHTRRVISENTAKNPVCGIYVGYTVYEVTHLPQTNEDVFIEALGGKTVTFEVVVRNRKYDGMLVVSKWDSEPITLNATTIDEAKTEGQGHATALIRYFRSLD